MQRAVSTAKVTVHVLHDGTWHENPLDEAPIPVMIDDRSQLAWIDIEGDPVQIDACLKAFLADVKD